MCTVTFIPGKDKVFITSNRDEKNERSHAIAPASYLRQTGRIIFPKDTGAGGTWFAMHENGNTVVLLNGGWVKHIPQPPYRKSRGLVLLDMVDSDDPAGEFLIADYTGIEPFTAIAWYEGKLVECRWDGKQKWQRRLAADIPHIWSSVTLYDGEVIARRETWFSEWLLKNPEPTRQDILLFHQFTGNGDSHNGLLMDRDGIVLTVSITSLESNGERGVWQYLDFKNKQSYQHEFVFSKPMMHR